MSLPQGYVRKPRDQAFSVFISWTLRAGGRDPAGLYPAAGGGFHDVRELS